MDIEKLKENGYTTPPKHKDFLAKDLFGGLGTIRDGALAFVEPGGGPMGMHTHDYNHIFIVAEGEITVITENEEKTVKENESIFVEGRKPHALKNNTDKQVKIIGITSY